MSSRTSRLALLAALSMTSPASAHQLPSNSDDFVSSQILQTPLPYIFPDQNAANTTHLFPMPKCNGIAIEEASIDTLQTHLSNGDLTSLQLATCYWQRMLQTNDYINSVLELNPDFFSIASLADKERKAGGIRGPVHGIPFLVKDNIATKDRMQTTAGSWALQGSIVPRDAHVVKKLREAGAVLMGKATLSEWADMRSNNYSEGYSARGGQSRSPFNFTVNPGGSSSGSAVGVAGGVVPFAVGTETDGSIINPAERNALVGIKPTVGLTSRAGVIPESEHQDSVGCLGKNVRDATYCLDAMYGPDSRDNYTLAQVDRTPEKGYAQFLADKDALKNATFGIPWNSFWVHADDEQLRVLLDMIKVIEEAGATIVNHTELLDYEKIVSPDGWNWDYGTTRGHPNESEYTVIKVDFYNNIKTYLSTLTNTPIHSLEDILAYNYANDGTEGGHPWPLGHPAFYSGQDGFLASLATKGVQDETYWQALEFIHVTSRERGIDHALRGVDALLVPPDVGQSYQIAAQAGYPVITIPAGVHRESGMPYGLAFMGSAWQEGRLVRWASAVEDVVRGTRFGTGWEGMRPRWRGWGERNVPVING